MKKNIISNIFAIILVLNLVSSCSDKYVKGVYIASKNEYGINIESSSLQNISADGGVIDMCIQASNAVQWEIQDLPEWISTSNWNGSGTQDIKFKVEPNESFTLSRTHIFNVVTLNSDWSLTLPVSVNQLKKTPIITLSPSDNASWTFEAEGGHKELTITSNINWIAQCEDDFVSLSKTSGEGDGTIIINVAPYSDIDLINNRSTSIYLKNSSNDDILQVIVITQTPLNSSIETENIKLEFDKKSDSRIYTNGDVRDGYSVYSDADWLSISKNQEKKIDVTLSVTANENDDERSSMAYIYLDNTNAIKYAFTVSQKGNAIVISPDVITFDANGGSTIVTVISDSQWKATNSNEWLTVQENGGSCTILAQENNSLNLRTGEISFNRTQNSGEVIGKTVKLNVTQQARKISSDSDIMQFGPESSSENLYIESDAQWSLTTNNDWIHLSASEGFGSKTVSVTVSNNSGNEKRLGALRLECLEKVIEISVVQESSYVNTPSKSIVLDATGGTASLTLSSNVAWAATSSSDWLGVSPDSGKGAATIQLSAPYNESANSRSSVVTISSIAGDIKINVSQNAPAISASKNALTFDYDGGRSEPIVVVADGDYNIACSASWITYTKSSNSIVINVADNEGEVRDATVILTLQKVNVSTTINITQKACPYAFVDLGLPSGTKWSAWNLGATSKEQLGSTYTFQNAIKNASAKCALPSYAQALELRNYGSWLHTKIDNVEGWLITGPNGNSIFLPGEGVYYNFRGEYWVEEYGPHGDSLGYKLWWSYTNSPTVNSINSSSYAYVRCVKK